MKSVRGKEGRKKKIRIKGDVRKKSS